MTVGTRPLTSNGGAGPVEIAGRVGLFLLTGGKYNSELQCRRLYAFLPAHPSGSYADLACARPGTLLYMDPTCTASATGLAAAACTGFQNCQNRLDRRSTASCASASPSVAANS